MAMLPLALAKTLRALAAAAAPAVPVLHTPLATGADQLAATAARTAGYRVHALLPFDAETYAADFAPGIERRTFTDQLARADSVTALAGCQDDATRAYVAVGSAVIMACDVMIAVWDGEREIVPGGTAHVVALALAAGRPVVHIRVGGAGDDLLPALLLRGDRVGPETNGVEPIARPLITDADFAQLIAQLPLV